MAKFKKGDRVALRDDLPIKAWRNALNIPCSKEPVPGKIYTVDISNFEMRGLTGISLKEIPLFQDGGNHYWDEDCFEKVVEQNSEKVEYRVVVVEIDKRVKEKREEVIFAN